MLFSGLCCRRGGTTIVTRSHGGGKGAADDLPVFASSKRAAVRPLVNVVTLLSLALRYENVNARIEYCGAQGIDYDRTMRNIPVVLQLEALWLGPTVLPPPSLPASSTIAMLPRPKRRGRPSRRKNADAEPRPDDEETTDKK